MDIETRTRTAFAAAVGAYLELSGATEQASATQWIGAGFPRGDGKPPLPQAQLLMLAVEREPGMGAEALYNTAALAFGGKMGGFEGLPEARRMAFTVFRAVAAVLPRDLPVQDAAPDVSFRMVQLEPRQMLRTMRGIDFADDGAPKPPPLKLSKPTKTR